MIACRVSLTWAAWYASVMKETTIKEEARRLVEELPEGATWDDLMYRIYVRQKIEAGLRDSEAGRTVDVAEVRARFGLAR
jgi:predicted transcriptional regulator